MKIALLSINLRISCAIGLLISFTATSATEQVIQTKNAKSAKPASVSARRIDSRFINKSKMSGYKGPIKTINMSAPPAPIALNNGSFINKSKPNPASYSGGIPVNDQMVLQSRDINSAGPQWQSFSDYLTVPKGCDEIPLNLIFTNSSNKKFQDLRITLAGKSIGTIKDFNGQPVLTRNLKGAIAIGDNLLTVQAIGPAGAKLNWKFVTAKIIVNKVNPTSFGPTDKVTIEGRNFSDRADVTKVFINDKSAILVSAKNNSLRIKPPTGLLSGKADLIVMVGNQKSTPVQVTIKGAPEVHGVNMVSTAPGQPLTISGNGFSPIASENIVTIGPYQAEIVSASPTSIECIVPAGLDEISPAYDLPIKVKTNNIESTDPLNSAKINVQLRVFD